MGHKLPYGDEARTLEGHGSEIRMARLSKAQISKISEEICILLIILLKKLLFGGTASKMPLPA